MRNALLAILVPLLAAVGAATALAEPAAVSLALEVPRAYGYHIGDLFTHRVHLALAPGRVLDLDSLPEPGRSGRWLELRRVAVQRTAAGAENRYTLVLDYQILNESPQVVGVGTPPLRLEVLDAAGERLPVVVDSWGLELSPLLPPLELPAGALPPLAPPRPPPAMPLRGALAAVAGSAVLSLTLAAWLAYAHWVLPWIARTNGPFARALRRLRRLRRGRLDRGCEQAALRLVHRAFDETGGERLFESGVDRFLQANPRFAPQREAILEFFAHSRSAFFDPGAAGGPVAGRSPAPEAVAGRLAELMALCRVNRDLERGL